jgi:hypothetical protein
MNPKTTYSELSRRYRRYLKWYVFMSYEQQNSALGAIALAHLQKLNGQLREMDKALILAETVIPVN